MNVLILGSGAREHALAWSIRKSKRCSKVYVSPGNDKILEEFSIFNFADFTELKLQIEKLKIDLVIPGSEVYLEKDIGSFDFGANIKVFGPTAQLARLETSKAWAKKLMTLAKIPTADFFAAESKSSAMECINSQNWPQGLVVKSDGLAAGKGVIVCDTKEQGIRAVETLSLNFGEKFVIEERLDGPEFSAFAIVHKNEARLFGSACDYKRRTDNELSPNTGGMGSYAPCDWANLEEVKNLVWDPLFNELTKQGLSYTGFLYAGLMKTLNGVKVIEFNVRLGDPETQALLPILKSDLLENILNSSSSIEFLQNKSSVHVVLVHPEYPSLNLKPIEISSPLLDIKTENPLAFFAGVKKYGNSWKTNGGRILGFTSVAESRVRAREEVYAYLKSLKMSELSFREGIGK